VKIQVGYELGFELTEPAAVVAMLSVHPDRAADLVAPDFVTVTPALPVEPYLDRFGNWCHRLQAPAGHLQLSGGTVVLDCGLPDRQPTGDEALAVGEVPTQDLVFLLPSRYCDSDRLADFAWRQFGGSRQGWNLVTAITQYAHERVQFGYEFADPSRTASQAHEGRRGVCRDFAHLAVALCRAMNVPARYCTGYLGDIGVAPAPEPMDFSAWFEVRLAGGWYSVDARHLEPRIGRIVVARGRDAADVALTTTFGAGELTQFCVTTHEV
jgi:transglutaminase-like putative cysteine protease